MRFALYSFASPRRSLAVAFLAVVAVGAAPANASVSTSTSAEGFSRETLRTLARPQGVA